MCSYRDRLSIEVDVDSDGRGGLRGQRRDSDPIYILTFLVDLGMSII